MLLNQSLGTGAKYATNTNPSVVGVNDNNLIYSVRKVVPTYTGYACRIRRSSDSAEADVSFDSSNKISADSVVTLVSDGSTKNLITGAGSFIDTDDAFVVAWYNQCRNTNAVTIGNTGSTHSFNTFHKLNLTGDFTITLELGEINYSQAFSTIMDIIHAVDTTSTAGDGILIENKALARGGYCRCHFNGSTISGSPLLGDQTCTFVVSRSGSTVDFSINGSSQGTVTDSSAISTTKFMHLCGDDVGQNSCADTLPIINFTVVDGSTTVYDIKDSSIFHGTAVAAAEQPRIINSGGLINTSNGDVSLEFDGTDQFLSPAVYMDRLSDTSSSFLAYAQADLTSVSSGNVEPVISQYQELSGTALAGAFYLGVDPNGWTAFLQSSTDGLNINTSGTSTLTRPTILGLGKPNSSSGTATFFRADATDGLYSEVNDTFNQSINTFYTGIGHANGSEYFDGHIVEIIVLNGGSVDETRRAFNEQRNYWGI